ncbi:MAG: GNAT family N-acetyltransferase [Pseudomonadota bacterium]
MNRSFTLRPAREEELSALSALCLRSKAHWGYDEAFMAACVPVLTLGHDDLADGLLIVAEAGGPPAGIAQLAGPPGEMEIDRLFVDPPYIGTGLGRVLFEWCVATALARGESRLEIEADPDAAPFYEKMGAVKIGETPSGAIPGRMLPLLELRISVAG